ncbi:glycine betaine/L-proline ABC transporter ATP-binding protein [Chelativorans sp. Marseille-P2723]|uniref:quaternary amine ABC transporter ATP-binding protein n=1 Tax=Chelativorans sp. Marseille-P2723 TaxID=2709133 RepID=UPI00156EE835|nr:glycine betaine/L-proline ABC transporter ATP-binding protein [Chelativorans sp. Marseille-P2723]
MKSKIAGNNIYKIFGEDPSLALDLLAAGKSKDEIYEVTGQAVGVHNVTFRVAEGEIFVVMGLSGSGKSTLVRMINGLIKPSSGEILIDGIDVASCSDEELRTIRREKVAMVFQHFALFPHKTVVENVAFGLKIRGVKAAERRERAQSALEQVGLGARGDSYPDELSGGMQQRVGLARGLASEPEILLMDEPFSALDPLIRSDMQQELLELQRTLKKTIVFITHDLNEALTLGNTIAIMRNGAIVQTGNAEEIVGNPANAYVAAFTRDIDRSLVFKAGSIARPPDTIDLGTDIQSALAHMEETGADAVHVLKGGKLAGIITYKAANAALREGRALKSAVLEEFPSTSPQSRLYDLYLLAEAGLPIALTDDAGELIGVVRPQDVFQQLAVRGASA